jgi:hypothetical protein
MEDKSGRPLAELAVPVGRAVAPVTLVLAVFHLITLIVESVLAGRGVAGFRNLTLIRLLIILIL